MTTKKKYKRKYLLLFGFKFSASDYYMKNIIIILVLLLTYADSFSQNDFRAGQKQYKRVRDAYGEKENYIKKLYGDKDIDISLSYIYIRGFKYEKILEVWAKNKQDTAYKHIVDYDFCSFSGKLGPKRRQGDMQIPEGFYYIDRFNPYSSFHLSLGINYPNKSDRILSKHTNLGGDIFIHGSCCTIGCIPITDDKIKELYIMAVEAKNNGQTRIPVHIFPAKITTEQINYLKSKYSAGNKMIMFWENLKDGYLYFEKYKRPPQVKTDKEGKYVF